MCWELVCNAEIRPSHLSYIVQKQETETPFSLLQDTVASTCAHWMFKISKSGTHSDITTWFIFIKKNMILGGYNDKTQQKVTL